ncbi:unnamed protein product [Ambrosiozyma monospora]|uniref:Unnamed protein product n=1 Tax=Ambrosiozyma monospora TaxID=43982 RepID=A0A9W6YT15_AMBMO|nr:unnamed protein product [Ambrosiozyma monospora]
MNTVSFNPNTNTLPKTSSPMPTPSPTTAQPTRLNQYACIRCRRLKKRCSKQLPKCANCSRQNTECEYIERKNKRRQDNTHNHTHSHNHNHITQSSPSSSSNSGSVKPLQMQMSMSPRHSSPLSSPPKRISRSSSVASVASLPPLFNHHSNTFTSSNTPPPPLLTKKSNYIFASAAEESVVNSLCSLHQQSSALRKSSYASTSGGSSGNNSTTNLHQLQQPSLSQPQTQLQYQSQSQSQPQYTYHYPYTPPISHAGSNLQQILQSRNGSSSAKLLNTIELELPTSSTINLSNSNLVNELLGQSTSSSLSGGKYSPAYLPNRKFETNEILKFIDTYMQYNHRSYPFLNEVEFYSKVNSITSSSSFNYFLSDLNDKDLQFQFELNMIISIGCLTLEHIKSLDPARGCSSYFAARALNLLNKLSNLNDSQSIRALILLCIYSFFDGSSIYAWNIVGLLTRVSISIGLNRHVCKKDQMRLTSVEIEMRYRLFWSIYNLDRLISIALGKPVSIQDDDINVPLPEPINQDERWSLLVTKNIIELRRLEGLILSNVHCMRASDKFNVEMDKQNILMSLRNGVEKWFSDSRLLSSTLSIHPLVSPKLSNGSLAGPASGSGEPLTPTSMYANTTNSKQSSFTIGPSSRASSTLSSTNGKLTPVESQQTEQPYHLSTAWLASKYNHLLMLLYKPSYLYPKLPPVSTSTMPSSTTCFTNNNASLDLLTRCSVQGISFTFNLYNCHQLPLNWVTLYRFIISCSTILYCLSASAGATSTSSSNTETNDSSSSGGVKTIVSKSDISLIIKLFEQGFGSVKGCEWCSELGSVFRKIDSVVFGNGVAKGEVATLCLVDGLKKFHEVLGARKVNVWYEDEVYDL